MNSLLSINNKRTVTWIVVITSTLGCIMPTSIAAETTRVGNGKQQVFDISLHDGELRGQVVGTQGVGASGVEVIATENGKLAGWAITDAIGSYRFEGMQPGTLQVTAAGKTRVCRVWSDKIAPPSARKELLFITDEMVVRGQHQMGLGSSLFGGRLANVFSSPLAVAGVMAAAIVIPIAVINDDDNAS